MYSAEGECVTLVDSMYPKGGVESWLLLVEEKMKQTVQVTLGRALINLAEIDRNKWVLVWPGQIVIAGCQTYWTAHVEEGLREHSLDHYLKEMYRQLDGLRSLVKGPLKRVERQILSALIVIEVHARDVTERLVQDSVQNVNDFEWISQLRYYWVNDADLKVKIYSKVSFFDDCSFCFETYGGSVNELKAIEEGKTVTSFLILLGLSKYALIRKGIEGAKHVIPILLL